MQQPTRTPAPNLGWSRSVRFRFELVGVLMKSNKAYQTAQRSIADLKAAVRAVIAQAGPAGLRNAEIGRMLGIYHGYADAGHVGHISRALLDLMRQEGLVVQDPSTKRWTLKGQEDAENTGEDT